MTGSNKNIANNQHAIFFYVAFLCILIISAFKFRAGAFWSQADPFHTTRGRKHPVQSTILFGSYAVRMPPSRGKMFSVCVLYFPLTEESTHVFFMHSQRLCEDFAGNYTCQSFIS